jgi:hypothetical protein
VVEPTDKKVVEEDGNMTLGGEGLQSTHLEIGSTWTAAKGTLDIMVSANMRELSCMTLNWMLLSYVISRSELI